LDENNLHRTVLDHVSDGVYFVDPDLKITFWNKAAETITGFRAEEVVGRHCPDDILRHVDATGLKLCLLGCPVSATLRDGQPREAMVFLHHKSGFRVPVEVRVMPVQDDTGRVIGAVETFRDNRHEMALLDRLAILEENTMIDPLTKLANRRAAEEEIVAKMDEYRRRGRSFGLLMVDVDLFKNVNDTRGHVAGDRLLTVIGTTLRHASRSYDLPARWGGEEFLVIAPDLEPTPLQTLCERHRVLVASSGIDLPDGRLAATVSIGGTLVRPDDQRDSLIERADAAMYESKKAGRNRVTIA